MKFQGEYRTAGGLLNNILGKDKKRWEEVVFRFAQVNSYAVKSFESSVENNVFLPSFVNLTYFEFRHKKETIYITYTLSAVHYNNSLRYF